MATMLPLNGLASTTSALARKNLANAQAQITESVRRLSSGVRLQHASDDAAGVAVASLITTQSQVVGGAQSNLGSATSMLQLADSALGQAQEALLRVRELISQSSNDSLSKEQYLSLAREIMQQLEEVQKLADRTSFNGNRILGGAGNNTIDVQRTVSSTQTSNITVGHPQGVWVGVDGSSAAGNLSGSLRVTISASNGVVRLTSATPGVTVDTPSSGGDAFSGTATSISFEGSRADVLTALTRLQGQRTATGDLDIAVSVQTVPSFTNGTFTNGLNGWTALNQRVRLNGADTVAGWPTPVDPTPSPQDGGTETSSTPSGTYQTQVNSSGRAVLESANLYPVANTPGSGQGGIVHGPALVSNSSVQIAAGNLITLDWEASGGQDAFDVFGYLVDVDTGYTEIFLNDTGTYTYPNNGNPSSTYVQGTPKGGGAQEVQPLTSINYAVQRAGNYKFVFLGGTWDATAGQVAGAKLTIDNISVTPTAPVQTNNQNFRVEAQRTVPVQTTITNTFTEQQTVPVNSETWEFLSGANEDRVQLQGIAIWGSAETAQQLYGNGLAVDPAFRTGSLSALYKRITWMVDQSAYSFTDGKGFSSFQTAPLNAATAPDQMVFDQDGRLTNSRNQSISQLVDAAMSQIQNLRAYFGTIATRVEKNIANLVVQHTGLSASGSRIRDTDYGFETARLTRMQILQQAATAMLAQANSMPSIVSALIKFQ